MQQKSRHCVLFLSYICNTMKDKIKPIRVSEDESEAFDRAAEINGISFSSWARQKLRAAAAIELQAIGEKAKFLESKKQG